MGGGCFSGSRFVSALSPHLGRFFSTSGIKRVHPGPSLSRWGLGRPGEERWAATSASVRWCPVEDVLGELGELADWEAATLTASDDRAKKIISIIDSSSFLRMISRNETKFSNSLKCEYFLVSAFK